MLALDDLGRLENYAYINGMRNIVWVSGFVRNITERGFLVQQVNNMNLAVPVELDAGDRLPSGFRETSEIKVIGHIFGTRGEDGEPIARLRAIKIDRPNLLEMPAKLAWEKPLPPGAPLDDFRPFGPGEDEKLRAAANVVQLAGIVDAIYPAQGENGKPQHDCLVIMLRQHRDAGLAIPVRLYGAQAAMIRRHVKMGMPVEVRGQYRVRVKELAPAEAGKVTPVQRLPYIHTNTLHAANRSLIREVTDWMAEIAARTSAQSARPASPAAPARAPAAALSAAELASEFA